MKAPGPVVGIHDSGREAADGAPHRAQRTARGRLPVARVTEPTTRLGRAGASTVGLAADRTRPESEIGR